MARLRFNRLLSQFLEGIISIFVARIAVRITFRQFAVHSDRFVLRARGFAAACLTIAMSMPRYAALSSLAAGSAFGFFGRGPLVGLALSARISVIRSTVISSR